MPLPHPAPRKSTRDRILQQLRLRPGTVDELARRVGVTPNGVRAQIAALERDGLVERTGVRHRRGAGQPPQLFAATREAEARYSEAYAPVLAALVATLGEDLPSRQLAAAFRAAGTRLGDAADASARGGGGPAAKSLLEGLGAAVSIRAGGGTTVVEGTACPIADAVRACPDSCEIVRAMLARATGTRVRMQCAHGDAPRCRFEID